MHYCGVHVDCAWNLVPNRMLYCHWSAFPGTFVGGCLVCRTCFHEGNHDDAESLKTLVTEHELRKLAAEYRTPQSFLEDKVRSAIVRMTAADLERTSFHYVFASDKIAQAAARSADRSTDTEVSTFVRAFQQLHSAQYRGLAGSSHVAARFFARAGEEANR